MPLVVNSNISSLNAQRQLVNSGAEMDKAAERLASGKRINSAADDAAGLAISNRQTSQIRGLDQAVRNANDGISMIQTAEGAMDETTNILQRMRELAVQSSNGIYSDSDRATLDAEVQQLKAEITRIADTTTFNGQKLLDGSRGEVKLQVGSEAGQNIAFEIGKLSAAGLGGGAGSDLVGAESTHANGLTDALAVIDGTDNTMTINKQSVGDLSTGTLQEKLDEINKNVSGVKVGAITELTGSGEATGIIRGAEVFALAVTGADGSANTLQIKDTGSMEELVSKINSQGAGLVKADLDEKGNMTLSNASGAKIVVTGGTAAGFAEGVAGNARLTFEITDSSVESVDIAYGGTVGADSDEIAAIGVQAREKGDIIGSAVTAETALVEGELKINGVEIGSAAGDATEATQAGLMRDAINAKSAETGVVASVVGDGLKLDSVSGKEIRIETTGTAGAATGLLSTNNASTVGNSVADLDISTEDGAQKAIKTIDTALEQINGIRADMGAVSNRLDFTVSNLSNVSENSSAARSRILDADFAAESAALSRAQVLQQASQAMLAQANARPQQVLSLLQ